MRVLNAYPLEGGCSFAENGRRGGAPRSVLGPAAELGDAVGADVLAPEADDAFRIVAENTGGVILSQYNGVSVGKYLKRILFGNVERTAHFDRQNDAAKLVDLSDYPGGFHMYLSFRYCGTLIRIISSLFKSAIFFMP